MNNLKVEVKIYSASPDEMAERHLARFIQEGYAIHACVLSSLRSHDGTRPILIYTLVKRTVTA